jgi:hypothetical protein
MRLPVLSEVKQIVYRMSEILLAAEIAFRRLHGCMSQQELNLLQLATAGGRASHRFSAHAACGMSGAMPNPELCRIVYEASVFGAELEHQNDQDDSA